jgi:hypothetical protein
MATAAMIKTTVVSLQHQRVVVVCSIMVILAGMSAIELDSAGRIITFGAAKGIDTTSFMSRYQSSLLHASRSSSSEHVLQRAKERTRKVARDTPSSLHDHQFNATYKYKRRSSAR